MQLLDILCQARVQLLKEVRQKMLIYHAPKNVGSKENLQLSNA